MYCKICHHNFNSGESYISISGVSVCSNCAMSTSLFDLVKKNLLDVETFDPIPANFVYINDIVTSTETPLEYTDEVTPYSELNDEDAINADFVVDANVVDTDTPSEIHSEIPLEYMDENGNVRHLEKRDPSETDIEKLRLNSEYGKDVVHK